MALLPTARVLCAFLLAASLPAVAEVAACSKPSPSAPVVREATGTIRGFGEGRKTVRIAHDEIPNYMRAMTMTFDAREPAQLAGLEEKDDVRFTFTDEPDGRYLLQSIAKR